MISWLSQYQEIFAWLALASAITFLVSLASLPWLVARIPEDYFLHGERHGSPLKIDHPIVRLALLIGKNTLGVTLLIGGFIMLFIPGQGLLTIAMGLLLMDYPGKFKLEQRLARNTAIFNGLNWLRARTNTGPLKIDREGKPDDITMI